MEICTVTGAGSLSRDRPVVVPGRPSYRARINPAGNDLPVTDRKRMSASEP
jgi:hypothetical protein